MSSIGVVVLHHDQTIVEQLVEAIEAAPGLFVAATSLEAGARASVVVAGGEPLHAWQRTDLPVVALAEGEPVRAARAALAVAARDIVSWPEESTRVGAAVRRAATSAPVAGEAAPLTVVQAVRGGLGTSTLAAMLATSLAESLAAASAELLVVDLDGGQRAFAPASVTTRVDLPRDPDPDVVRALAVEHAGASRALHLGHGLEPAAARGLFRAARQAAAAVVVDAGKVNGDRSAYADDVRSILVVGCDVASVRAARAVLDAGADPIVVLRKTRYSLSRRSVAAALERRVDLLIKDDPEVVRAGDLGRLPPASNRTMRAVARLARSLKAGT